MKVTRKEFVKRLTAKAQANNIEIVDREVIDDVIDALFGSIAEEIGKGNQIQVRKFGRFRMYVRERATKNPKSGERLGVRTECVVNFTPYDALVKVHG